MNYDLQYIPFGNKALLIEWPKKIDALILNDILSFKTKIESENTIIFEDLINGYNSLTITYHSERENFEAKIDKLKQLYSNLDSRIENKPKTWQIPVCYDESFGIDLKTLSEDKNMSIEEIISLHSNNSYTVYFIGFLPGFLYLGGLNDKLHCNRKATPRLNVAKGSVAIGGSQTGVYPSNSAGGWQIIGKTPIPFFDIKKTEPCFAKAGDIIQFKPITLEAFNQLEIQIENGEFQLKPKTDD